MLESEGMVLDEWVSESYRGAEVRFGGVKFVLGRWGDDPVLRLSGCDDILCLFCCFRKMFSASSCKSGEP